MRALGMLSEEGADTSPAVLYVSVVDVPVNVNVFSVERMNSIGINVPIEWELCLQMCNTQCDVYEKGIWCLAWRLLNSLQLLLSLSHSVPGVLIFTEGKITLL